MLCFWCGVGQQGGWPRRLCIKHDPKKKTKNQANMAITIIQHVEAGSRTTTMRVGTIDKPSDELLRTLKDAVTRGIYKETSPGVFCEDRAFDEIESHVNEDCGDD